MRRPFKYVWAHEPIDWWCGACVADLEETERVLGAMPEEPRENIVFKIVMPDGYELVPVYFCKASNNGTVYIFSDYDVNKDYDGWYAHDRRDS